MQGKEVVLRFVRDQLSRINAHALIVPTSDSHQSEYVAGYDKVRQYVSGFTGSAGTAIVTNPILHPLSQLFTDGRYHEQAEKELDLSLWELQKSGLPTVLSPEQWLIKQFTHNTTTPVPTPHIVAYDPLQLSVAQYKTFSTAFSKHNITLAPTATNFVSDAWNSLDSASREPISTSYVSVQTPEFSGPTTAAQKVEDLRKELIGNNAFALVLSALDDIAWTFNLRGSDIAFNPVFKSYAIITDSETILLVDDSDDKSRLVDAKKYLEDDFKAANSTLRILPYSDMQSVVTNIGNEARIRRDTGSHPNFLISIDPTKTNMMTYNAIDGINGVQGADEIVLSTPSPVAARKAVKNAIEIAGMENSHIRDGLAVSSFLAYLESRLCDFPSRDATAEEKANSPYNEHTLASKLESYRAKQPLFKGLSFDTISSIGPNGSIIHYKPSETDSAPLTTGKVFLLDSGAQYNDGTTDITRTFFLSKPKDGEVVIGDEETDYAPSREQVTNNTLVLQGHIALCMAVFPKGTVGPALDILARQFLWKAGLDYAHGTGHGVGSYLNVHEGPLGVSPLSRGGLPLVTPLVPGMVLSNEPGFYKPGGYGIRIENLVQVVPATVPNPTATLFYTLKNLTMVPLDRTLIDISMLSTAEKEWVNEYHDECKSNLIALLDSQQDDTKIHESKDDVERTRRWILRNTEAL